MYFLFLVYFIYILEYEYLLLYFKVYDIWDFFFFYINDRIMYF